MLTNDTVKGCMMYVEQRIVGQTVYNDMLIIIVAQCLVCACVCLMDSVFSIQPLETTKVYHNRLLVMPLDRLCVPSYKWPLKVHGVDVIHWCVCVLYMHAAIVLFVL